MAAKYNFFVSIKINLFPEYHCQACTVQVRDKRPTHTQNARTFFAQTHWKTLANTRICAQLMRVFPFVIHSYNYAFCGIVLRNRKQGKRQFLQTPLTGYLRRQRNSRHVFPLPCFLIALYNPITERTKKVRIFIYVVLQVISKCLEALLLEF